MIFNKWGVRIKSQFYLGENVMATRNIEINYKTNEGYDILYPNITARNVIDFNDDVNLILKNSTKALFGLDNEAVPDDVLAWLGKYNQYWWKRRANSSHWAVKLGVLSPYSLGRTLNQYYDLTFNCSTEVSVDSSGTVSQAGTLTTISANYVSYSKLAALRGLYFKPQYGGFGFDYNSKTYIAVDTSEIYYVPPSANYVRTGNNPYYMGIDAQLVGSEWIDVIGDWEYIQSSERNAYPDSGTQDGYEYQFLGRPLDNAVTAPKIKTGSYIGTGVYGSNNPNNLTIDVGTKMVIVIRDNQPSNFGVFFPNSLSNSYIQAGYYSSAITGGFGGCYARFSGNLLSWYYTSNTDLQFNNSSNTYSYIIVN